MLPLQFGVTGARKYRNFLIVSLGYDYSQHGGSQSRCENKDLDLACQFR